jgi:putative peptidoglycan lipid II flippase
MLKLLRLMFPYVLLVCLAALFIGILNSRGYFFVPAMGATMLNVVMIASVLWLAPRMGGNLEQQIFGLAIGVVIAGIAQAAFQVPLLRKEGFRYQWVSPWRDETVRRVVTKMIPGAVGVAAFQINVLITQSIAFWAGVGVVSSFTVAVRLMELPQGGFGISLATYLLPTLSGLAAEKKYPEFRAALGHGLSWLLFVNLLASALLFTLAEPMIRLLFERGEFTDISTANSTLALKCLAPGLVAFSIVNILARAFYALGDTQTPMRISIFCLGINMIFAAALVWHFKQGGLGIANTLSAMTNMTLLLYALRKKLKTLDLAGLVKPLIVLTAAAVIAGAVAWKLESVWNARIGHYRLWLRVGEVFVPIGAASAVYIAIAAVFKTGHLGELIGMFRSHRRPA